MSKLTQKSLEAIRADRTGETIRDDGGLFGRVRTKLNGEVSISFYYRYRFDGRFHDLACGTWPAKPLKEIRATRNAARDLVANRINPANHRKATAIEQQNAIEATLLEAERKKIESLTLKDLFDAWLIDGVRRRDGNAELQRSFKADVLPKIGKKKIKALTEGDLRIVLRAMVGRGVNRAAVLMRNDLMQMFKWAEKRQPWRNLLAEGNPVDLIEIEKIVSPDYDLDNQRSRILTDEEIRELHGIFIQLQTDYDNAPNKRSTDRPIETTTQCAIWIMLSTLSRVGELTMARWEHVNLDAGEWFIPRENVKGRTSDLSIYLSGFAENQFRRLATVTGHSEWCFPSRNNESHVCVKSISKQVGDRQTMFKKAKDGGPRQPMKNRKHDNSLVLSEGKSGAWTPHDLRRTGATMMQSLGVLMEIIDRCQNHVLEGSKVRRHYLHHDYAEEKREAWKLLGERLEMILHQVPRRN